MRRLISSILLGFATGRCGALRRYKWRGACLYVSWPTTCKNQFDRKREETLKRINQSSQPTTTLVGEALSHHVPDVVTEERSFDKAC
jgi:hypothetical protein